MILGKIFKLIFKILVFFLLLIFAIIAIIKCSVDTVKYGTEPYNTVSYMIREYDINNACADGTWISCPVCDNAFHKANGFNFCSKKCSDEYWEIYDIWTKAEQGRLVTESYGKSFK